ncbi:hypothetical protein TsFJ059_009160 [Trichoderma semiorbis]|uniref:Uncharacterized protein n=1 Tax=Trichoderma semiorbis TaxID=1491008 RepID=A0A9P8KNW4_9HYPO|nr:hypothetical protein TsFJ059_009160 [Trichoderma semiorbis]
MPPARHEAPRRRQNQLIDLLWVVFILFSLICIAMIIAVTIITITTAGSTMPCICPTPTATSAAIATSSDVVAVGAPLVPLPFMEAMELFPVWAPWRRLNNPCAF